MNTFEEIIKNVNFNTLSDIYAVMEWTWAFPYEDRLRIPSPADLINCVFNLKRDVDNYMSRHTIEEEYWVETGGLRVGYNAKSGWFIMFIKKF